MSAANVLPPSVLIVIGVAGSGKTTVGALVARMLRWDFADADTFHSRDNVRKMSAGIALTDEDRWPWLRSMAAWIDAKRLAGGHAVLACSALKRTYRRVLVADRSDVRLVYLKASPDVIRERMLGRQGHFMPVDLLQSQFATLEEPEPDENAIVVTADAEAHAIARQVLAAAGLPEAAG